MFAGNKPNPYEDIVAKTTDENLTSENWELILNLCDKVNDEGEAGARNVIAALLKRLAHRNPNVQLYSLSLAEALSKNCGIDLHREMASRSFTQGLEKLITDRTTHEKVKRRGLYLISLWTGEFESNAELGLMEELYDNLKAKNFKFEQINEPPPPEVDDEVRRREEEELQRVLEMSLHDKGGRGASSWGASGSSGAGSSAADTSTSAGGTSSSVTYKAEPAKDTYSSYSSRPKAASPVSHAAGASSSSLPDQVSPTRKATSASGPITRVRALHDFEPTVAGELAFQKGDIIKVTDRAYDNWWRGQLRGRTGIFPVNYVEPLPDLTAEEIAREAEQEAAVFAQAANIDKLISMLRGLDPNKDNLADNEEIQELYRSSMALRPKIVKLIDKYSQKRAELVAMNESFVKARGVFEQMMEESLARHTGVYESQYRRPRPESRGASDYHASTYGWNAAGYEHGYAPYPGGPTPGPYQGPPYAEQTVYSGQHQPPAPFTGQMPQGPQPYPPADSAYAPPLPQTPAHGHPPANPASQQPYPPQSAASIDPQSYPPQNPQAYGSQQPQQPQVQGQSPTQGVVPPTHGQTSSPPQQGPPYVYDPNMQYNDPNVQAWAQYYAQGGTDPSGAVYFISVPGVKEAASSSDSAPASQGAPTQGQGAATVGGQAPSQPVQDNTPQPYPPQQGQAPATGYQSGTYGAPPASPHGQHAGQPPPLHIQPGYQGPDAQGPPQGVPPHSAGPYSAAPHGHTPTYETPAASTPYQQATPTA